MTEWPRFLAVAAAGFLFTAPAHAQDAVAAQRELDAASAKLRAGATGEAEALFRRAVTLDARATAAYVNLARLVGASPARWQRRDDIVAMLRSGLAALADDQRGRHSLTLALADFERSVGRLSEARAYLGPLLARDIPPAVRKRALDVTAAIAADESAQALADWPEPSIPDAERASVRRADGLLDDGQPAAALAIVSALLDTRPAFADARLTKARALEALGRHDRAAHELTILLQLRPSHAAGWRLLGMILSQHGGTLEAGRADEALRRALALEPSWDDLRVLRRKVAETLGTDRPARTASATPSPSREAQKLFEEAHRWIALDTPEMGEAVLAQALADSPHFIEAAVSYYALAGKMPAATIKALWNDGDGLGRLAAQVQSLRKDAAVAELVKPWLDRAVLQGSPEARFARALARADSGDQAGALADLTIYVATDASPARLSEAQALRSTLLLRGAPPPSAPERARLLLLANRPQEAERVLGGPCRGGLAGDVLVELGRVRAYLGEGADALACYRMAADAAMADALAGTPSPALRPALERLSVSAARAPLDTTAALLPYLRAARRADVPAAAWALARLARREQRWAEALALALAFLDSAASSDPMRPEVLAVVAELRAGDQSMRQIAGARRLQVLAGVAAALALVIAGLLYRRLRQNTLARILRRRPEFYPEIARLVGEIRHDVIKHRSSGLALLTTDPSRLPEIARALLEPTPASQVVADAYARLRQLAADLGTPLRPLAREPTLGPLHRDLVRAESLAATPSRIEALIEIDRALREHHTARLAELVRHGPSTRLDPATLSRFIRAVEAERGGAAWTPPALLVRDLDVEVQVTESVLATVLANLLRNAAAAVASSPNAQILVRVAQERDVTGRKLATLVVADSAPGAPTLDDIERRDGQRGLGIVRDLVRRWGGHLVVQPEAAPLAKSIGAAFPVSSAQEQP